MDELTAFVSARLDEDEAMAKRNIGAQPGLTIGLGDTEQHGPSWPDYQTYSSDDLDAATDYLDRFRPLRMLREVEAKRAILALHRPYADEWPACNECSCSAALAASDCFATVDLPCPTILAIAAVWSDHPDYRAEWAA